MHVILALVQSQVMEWSQDIMLLQELDQARTLLQVAAHDIEHVGIVGGIARNLRQTEEALSCQSLQADEVLLPQLLALSLNIV